METTARLVKPLDYQAAEKLLQLRRGKGLWAAIDEIVKMWKKLKPIEWEAYIIRMPRLRQTRRNQKFADTKKTHLRYLIDVPMWIVNMIRALYKTNELKLDKKFWMKFGKKYPFFKVSEKL